MKKIIAIGALAAFTLCGYTGVAQKEKSGAGDVGKIALNVVVPQSYEGLTPAQLSKLQSKITRVATANGMSGSGMGTFVLYPKVELYDEVVVEGMKNITVVEGEVTLFVKQLDNNVIFSTYSRTLKGSGFSKSKAVTDLIKKIPTRDPKVAAFLKEAKEKIIAYYEAKCDDIIAKADNQVKMQQYKSALGTLMQVPEEVSCYSRISDKAVEVYQAYSEQHCKEQMQAAKASAANNDYRSCLYALSQIDPSSSCSKDAESLMKQMAAKVDAEEKKEWDFMMKRYNDSVSLEKQRINAVKEVASAYYKSQPKTVNYTTVIK